MIRVFFLALALLFSFSTGLFDVGPESLIAGKNGVPIAYALDEKTTRHDNDDYPNENPASKQVVTILGTGVIALLLLRRKVN